MAETVKQAAKREPKPSDKPLTEKTLDKAGPTAPMPDGQPGTPRIDRVDRLNTPGS